MELDLKEWWFSLSSEWKSVFFQALNIETRPTDDEMEKMINLKEINCGKLNIDSLEPLKYMTNLELLICFRTNITSLEPLRNLHNLKEIRFFETEIEDLEPIKNLTNFDNLSKIY